MHGSRTFSLSSIAAVVFLAGGLRAAETDTALLSQPAVSANHIGFIYADDLWVADLDGKNPRRLTSDIGVELNPHFSPDGQTIAFSAQYDGNVDVFTIPITGGPPKRLTTHPGPDIVRGWTPDGSAVLFSSPRNVFTNRYSQLFTVPTSGGMPTQLPIPNGVEASYSPDGEQIAYTPIADRSGQWKHYRGGTHSRIWVYRRSDHHVDPIPQPGGRCNDADPQWLNGTIYFRSDRHGEFNVFAYDTKSKQVRQVTKHTDFPVQDLGSGGGHVVYEQGGHIHLLDPSRDESKRLAIGVTSDLSETRPRFAKGAKYIRGSHVSPSGARAVFEFRGEIVTVPAEKGDPRNLTNTVAVHERAPAWSPDGKSIAYFSDASGEYRLHVRSAEGHGDAKPYDPRGAGFYEATLWSPDSKKIAYVDNSQSVFWIDLDGGALTKVASEPLYGPAGLRTLRPAWSPDSKWLVYSLGNKAAYHTVYAHNVETKQTKPITDGLSDAIDPVFDQGGKYLHFFASTDAGPVNHWFAQSSADMRVKRSIYLVVLKKGEKSPLARESDEEKGAEANDEKKKEEKDGEKKDKKIEPVAIDFDGIDQRIVAMPIPAEDYQNLQTGSAGQLFFIENPSDPQPPAPGAPPPGGTLKRFDLGKRKLETVVPNVRNFDLTADGKKALVSQPPETWAIVEVTGDKPPADKGKLKVDAIEVRVDPRAEWRQVYDEVWRINRDYFYDPGMHGANWKELKWKYESFLPHLTSSSDLYRVLRWMMSELAVGHSYTFPGERAFERKNVPGGLLGADYEVANNRYRFKKVYGGLNWTPDLRAPLTAPGVDVKAGEYLLAVRGVDLRPPTEVYSLFENTADKSIELTVGPNADGTGSRTVTVEPLDNESALRNRDWIEGNLKKVQKATDGRVAYVYVPNTAGAGHQYFKRYFFPQSDKQGVIVDERFNGGGSVADYYIDLLRRPFTAMWATRYGQDIKTPQGAIHGPKVMLIDETAGSGGDLLPWMFRHYQLGPLVGKRTWGGLVGILGFPILMDGGRVTAPNLAFWTPGEGFGVENVGVPPDVEVEQWPADVIAGRDPQLEKAIELVLAELEKHPPPVMQRPPYPVRVKP
jgi:tricorn protease